jgi:hypothetical protein
MAGKVSERKKFGGHNNQTLPPRGTFIGAIVKVGAYDARWGLTNSVPGGGCGRPD